MNWKCDSCESGFWAKLDESFAAVRTDWRGGRATVEVMDWFPLEILADWYEDHDQINRSRAVREIVRMRKCPSNSTHVRQYHWAAEQALNIFHPSVILVPSLGKRLAYSSARVIPLYHYYRAASRAYRILIDYMVKLNVYSLEAGA